MGNNINKRTNPLIFIDLDGTIVLHNYEVEKNFEYVIPSTINTICMAKRKGYELCLTTARSKEDCENILEILRSTYDIIFDYILYDLPAGERILINDYTVIKKAKAINVKRNQGVSMCQI